MKNILYKFLPVALFFGIVLSCKQEDNKPAGILYGVDARAVFAYPDNTYINFADIANAAVKFDLYTHSPDIAKIEYSASYTNFASGTTTAKAIVLTVTGSQFQNGKVLGLTIKATDIATALNLPGGTAGLAGGDSFNFTTKAYLKDGRTYDASNLAPSIGASTTSSFTSFFGAFVGCPSDQVAIAGTYTAYDDYNDGGEPTGVPHTVTITFVGPQPFRYHVTDHTGQLYVPYGGTSYPADFFDICGTPILLNTVSFGQVVNYVPTPADIAAGFETPLIDTSTPNTVIQFTWHETFNDIKASMRFVKQ